MLYLAASRNRYTHQRKVFTIACLLAAAFSTYAGEQGNEPVELRPRSATKRQTDSPASLRADVQLVLVPVTVTDPLGAPIAGLPRETFRLYEGGVEQNIQYFSAEDTPVSLGIVFDASRSMTDKLDESRAAVTRVCNASTKGDEYSLIEFNSAARILLNFTDEPAQVEKTALSIIPRNWTALFDGVYLGVSQMKHARNARKVILLISDGGDNRSRYSEREMRALVREADVCIFSIGLFGGIFVPRHASLLKQISEETGGKFYQVSKVSELPDVVKKISDTIRNQYVLGYAPANPGKDGLYRKVEVRLDQPASKPGLQASWRTGYYAPDER